MGDTFDWYDVKTKQHTPLHARVPDHPHLMLDLIGVGLGYLQVPELGDLPVAAEITLTPREVTANGQSMILALKHAIVRIDVTNGTIKLGSRYSRTLSSDEFHAEVVKTLDRSGQQRRSAGVEAEVKAETPKLLSRLAKAGVAAAAELKGKTSEGSTTHRQHTIKTDYRLVAPAGQTDLELGRAPWSDSHLHGDPRHAQFWLQGPVVSPVDPDDKDTATPLCRIDVQDPSCPVFVTITLSIGRQLDCLFAPVSEKTVTLAENLGKIGAVTLEARLKALAALRRRVANISGLRRLPRSEGEPAETPETMIALASVSCGYWPRTMGSDGAGTTSDGAKVRTR